MEYGSIRARHYDVPAALSRRSRGDLDREAMARRLQAGPLLEELLSPRPERPSLISSAQGRIDRLLLTIPAYAVESPALAAVYRDLLRQLAHVRLVVLTHESVRNTVANWLSDLGGDVSRDLIDAADHLHFSIWAEDGYVAVENDGGSRTFLLEPYAFPRYGDGLIAEFVANATDIDSSQAPLYFQGGNLLIGDDFFLIGADYPANTLAEYVGRVLLPVPGTDPVEFVRGLYGRYMDPRRKLHYVGSTIPVPATAQRPFELDGQTWTEYLYLGNRPGTVQPLFHIDMFITLAGRDDDGRYQVLVGDPRLAAQILDVPLVEQAMAEVFDNIARGLGRLGFAVLRNALPLVYVDDLNARERYWYFATSNNALVEVTSAGNKVWLPTYAHGSWASLAATDDANSRVWSDLGFEVHRLGDFHPFAENLGAAHCIKKYLHRLAD